MLKKNFNIQKKIFFNIIFHLNFYKIEIKIHLKFNNKKKQKNF